MDMKEIMTYDTFVVLGDTLREGKYAHQIKSGLLEQGYNTFGVGQELESINDVPDDIDIIDLCINAKKGLELMKDCKKSFKCIVIQPGAESEELISYLNEMKYPYEEACVLVGLSVYGKGHKAK